MAITGRTIGATLLALLLLATPMAIAADEDGDFQGNVELTVRSLSQSGSDARYDEDFDGLDSGARLSNLELEWFDLDSRLADYLRIDANSLGGDPYERAALRVGRRDLYELRVSYRSQDYIYNLFDVVDDLDGSSWDSRRQFADVGLTFHITDTAEMFVEFQQVERDGSSLVLADVNTELYQLNSPLDQMSRRYSVGSRFQLGSVDVLFRQTLRRYDYRFDNSTSDNDGLLDNNFADLMSYNWLQDDEGETDLTTLTVSAPIGDRVQLTASAFGTFLGDETIESDVTLNAEGKSFQGSCAVSGAVCSATSPCDTGIPGNFCIPDDFSVTGGTSRADIDADYTVLDADLSLRLRDDLDFHIQSRTLDREVKSTQLRDLDGNSVADDLEGTVMDTTPGSVTRVDYSVDTLTGLLDYAPSSRYRFRLGYRTISRELRREGFEYGTNDFRNTPFESDDDDTVVISFTLKPVDWLRVDGSREEGDITQAFTAVAPMETNRTRLRARFTPKSKLNLDIAYSDYDNSNFQADFRQSDCATPGADIDSGCWASRAEGESYSARISHRPVEGVDYWFSWVRNDIDSAVRVRFDTNPFLGAENGDSTYDNRSTELAGRINVKWQDAWSMFLRARINSADGSNQLVGATFTNNIPLVQDFSDIEAGLTYMFDKGWYLGARVRMFDYDDANDRLDYDGDIVALVAGMKL